MKVFSAAAIYAPFQRVYLGANERKKSRWIAHVSTGFRQRERVDWQSQGGRLQYLLQSQWPIPKNLHREWKKQQRLATLSLQGTMLRLRRIACRRNRKRREKGTRGPSERHRPEKSGGCARQEVASASSLWVWLRATKSLGECLRLFNFGREAKVNSLCS